MTEVATFRSDGAYSDGRRPDAVRFSPSPEEDVKRRDFTINGMMLDPADDTVLDFVGGMQDLQAGLIRAIGDPAERFTEDKLRMLRGVRFAARFAFDWSPRRRGRSEQLAPAVSQVSRERVREELTRMLTEGHARRAFELLDATGLLAQVLPEVVKMKGVAQPPQYHPEGDVWVHTLLLLDGLPAGCPWPWRGPPYCTTLANRRLFAWRLTAYASTGMWRLGCVSPKRFAAVCDFPITKRSRSCPSSPTTCVLPTCER